jgi:hypothetical protein
MIYSVLISMLSHIKSILSRCCLSAKNRLLQLAAIETKDFFSSYAHCAGPKEHEEEKEEKLLRWMCTTVTPTPPSSYRMIL